MTDNLETDDDVASRLIAFTTSADVPSEMSGHLDRFDSDEDWDAACLAVWRATEYRAGAHWIAKHTADLIMDTAVERLRDCANREAMHLEAWRQYWIARDVAG